MHLNPEKLLTTGYIVFYCFRNTVLLNSLLKQDVLAAAPTDAHWLTLHVFMIIDL